MSITLMVPEYMLKGLYIKPETAQKGPAKLPGPAFE
jgi:hypothetical protein